MSQLISFRF